MLRSHEARKPTLVIISICLLYWARKAIWLATSSSSYNESELYSLEAQHGRQYGTIVSSGNVGFAPEFPRVIWQTSRFEDKLRWSAMTATWTTLNPQWQYIHLDDDAATEFVRENFAHQPSIVQFWNHIGDKIIRADLLRYLVLLAQGGLYSDIDTSNLRPIDDWIPQHLYPSVNAVIGIEYDDKPMTWALRPVSFCQWTMMAKPGHPLFKTIVQRAMSNLDFVARMQRVDLSEVKLDFRQVLAATGPGLMTDVVIEVLRDRLGPLTFETFHDIREPSLFGDILILPINGFAGNQRHSHSGEPGYGEKLVQHHFGRSWYHKGEHGEERNIKELG